MTRTSPSTRLVAQRARPPAVVSALICVGVSICACTCSRVYAHKDLAGESRRCRRASRRQKWVEGLSSPRSRKHQVQDWSIPLSKHQVSLPSAITAGSYSGYKCLMSFSAYSHSQTRSTYLTAFKPAATIFWNISSHRSGTGRWNVWNSPELRGAQVNASQQSLGVKRKGLLTRRTCVDHGGTACSCPTGRHR